MAKLQEQQKRSFRYECSDGHVSDESDVSRVTNNSSLLKVINVKTGKTVVSVQSETQLTQKNVLVTFKK